MRILFVCDPKIHGHDYGVDWLIQGAYSLLGAGNVFEFPEKDNLHINPMEDRDACSIDSDAWLPRKGLSAEDIRDMDRSGHFDCVILTCPFVRMTVPWKDIFGNEAPKAPLAVLNYSDSVAPSDGEASFVVGPHRFSYFHRENPTGTAHPLFLSQPSWRATRRRYVLPRVFYVGTNHNWGDAGTRFRMVESLKQSLPDGSFLGHIVSADMPRMPNAMYRDRLIESAVSVAWNSNSACGFPVWDSNRFWESIAAGCCLVAERPIYRMPEPMDGVVWADSPEEFGYICKTIIESGDYMALGAKAQSSFLAAHTSEHRLRYVVETTQKENG